MNLLKPGSLAVLAVFAAGLVTGGATAQILTNGNFEVGPVEQPSHPLIAVAPGSNALTGWTVTASTVQIVTDNYWVPLSGRRSLVLSSTGPGSIQQDLSTAPGALYRLTFWQSGEPFSSPTVKHLRVTAGATTQDFAFDVTPAWHWDMGWQQRTLDFAASGGMATLKFTSLDASSWGPAIDSAKVELVAAGAPASTTLGLSRVTPDPVRSRARVTFALAAGGPARLSVYDIQGRERVLLADDEFGAGPHAIDLLPHTWGAHPGVYLAVLRTPGGRFVQRFTVLD